MPLRIVTWNLKDGIGAPGSARAIAFGKVITVQDLDATGPNTGLVPDVVCLQEVDQGDVANLTAFRNTHLPGYDLRTANGDGFNFNATLIRPGIIVVSSVSFATPGPRDVVKTKIQPAGALKPLWVYNAHFKAFSDASSQSTRTQEANSCGNNASFELNFGGGVNVVFTGDLNSNNNSDGTLSGLFFTSTNPLVSSGINNLPVETLSGRTSPSTIIATFPGQSSRLDYICLDNELASQFEFEAPAGSYTQAELNSMGFVYYSNEDNGLRANGDSTATNVHTDHRPVVFDLLLPRNPALPYFEPADLSQNGAVDAEDLYQWERAFTGAPPP
ncbi:MAG TPA: hypothetical protein DEB06_10455, partial [Phycisphaerales bacterium]|nr:hypothetical protein [Phycisphaerales bacterium]